MSFLLDVAEKFGWEREDFCLPYKVSVYGRDCVLIEGHRGIFVYEGDEVGFRLKGGKVWVRGKHLTIREINRDEAFVKGAIEEIVYG